MGGPAPSAEDSNTEPRKTEPRKTSRRDAAVVGRQVTVTSARSVAPLNKQKCTEYSEEGIGEANGRGKKTR